MQASSNPISCTAFVDRACFAKGSLQHVVTTVKDSLEDSKLAQILIFNDGTGKPIDVDFRGSTDEVLDRLSSESGGGHNSNAKEKENEQPARKVGRPKLGVVSGEVTLLPRQWDWLKAQPGGASVTLRKLIDEARRVGESESKVRAAQEASYHFMTAMAGDLNQYEEALRALYAGNEALFHELIDDWTPDIRDYVKYLAKGAFMQEDN
ncbi:DUF2239 family protein [Paenibacillus silvae]|uniref:DUF2239 family protein n=1 Tax=Paenibacillus silvae TaxID=1325358 RepID=UPI002005475B|nr:DUF2239 family protein [Paenibacillus silvae]MCK6073269.1 DUF2239 family protein [Paenibacillus silvae]MCK6149255.1 DUF2239 family protein [Paenibacillus silvae]MCK6267554.1 DUF2239 family protein [Paenibacillus silvae]